MEETIKTDNIMFIIWKDNACYSLQKHWQDSELRVEFGISYGDALHLI
mgnify:CR=1 FL=1